MIRNHHRRDNREVGALRDLIRDTDPDLILLSEPNQWWLEQLDGLEDDLPLHATPAAGESVRNASLFQAGAGKSGDPVFD